RSIPIMARFSGRLSAKFFEDSTARALFRTCGKVKMNRLAKVFSECKQLTDEDHISKEDFEYLICLRSGFVSLRQENYRITSDYVIWWSKVHRFESTKSKTISIAGKSSSLSQPKSLKSHGNEVLVHDKLARGKVLRVHPEVEGSSTTPASRVQHPPPVDVPPTRVPNDKGETE
ncbi:PREDICTED: VITISV_043090, partial [Prunus dulcis]